MNKDTYDMSDDCNELARLMKAGKSIACAMGENKGYPIIERAFYSKNKKYNEEYFQVGNILDSRERRFISRCKQANVRFIDPASQIKGRCGECKDYDNGERQHGKCSADPEWYCAEFK